MSLQVDFLVVGSGLTGATIARTLVDAGCEVLVVERRNHVGGNVHDHVHSSGLRIHTYGPHYFRTNSEEIWRYVNRFAEFFPYEAVVKTLIDGHLEQWPLTAQYIDREVGTNWQPSPDKRATNFEEVCLGIMRRLVYQTPQNSDHYEYPFPDLRNQLLYEAYRSRVVGDARLMICGRLGEYRYFDMDQAIGRALRIARKILRSMPLRLRDYSSAARIHPELLSAAGKALTSKKTSEPPDAHSRRISIR